MKTNILNNFRGLLAIASLLITSAVYADPTVELQILNATGANGDIIVVSGEDIEVSFSVLADTNNALHRRDKLQLIDLNGDVVVSDKNKGPSTSGSVMLKVPRNTVAGQFYVRYVRRDDGSEVVRISHPDDGGTPLVVIENATLSELTSRVAALEVTDPVAGPQGDPGPQGIQGLPGTDGTDGAMGLQGLPGVAGTDGVDGAQGLIGLTGAQGIPGNDGAFGATGSQGIQGVAGNDGADGATGPQGPQGVAGNDGANGAQGIQGIPGNDGVDGATGLQGLQGVPGAQGATGTEGPQGVPGIYAGPIGTIVTSMLNAATFAQEVGDSGSFDVTSDHWIPADGRTVTGSDYAVLVSGNVPDLRGMFVRGLNTFENVIGIREDGNEDPDGDLRSAGEYQSDEFKDHNHGFTHRWADTVDQGNMATYKSGTNDNHSAITLSGGTETRPKNISVYYYIKINRE